MSKELSIPLTIEEWHKVIAVLPDQALRYKIVNNIDKNCKLSGKFKVGDFVKYHSGMKIRIIGVITGVYESEGILHYELVIHNGMKPTHEVTTEDKLELITREKFIEYIKETGYTSLYKYVK